MAENTTQDIQRLSSLYTGMSEEQLLEILEGEKAGIDFTSYASSDLSAAEMRKKREELIDSKRLAVTSFECRYFYGSIKYFEFFDNPRELLYSSLVEEKNGVSYRDIERWASSNGQLQGKMNKIYESLTSSLEVRDIFETDECLPDNYANIVKSIKVNNTPLCLEISLGVNGVFDVYKAFGKGEFDKNSKVTVTPDTAFSVRAKLSSGLDSYFTLALKSEDFSIAIGAVPNRSATKSDADLAVVIRDKNTLYYDNAAKYMSPALLVAGLRS